MGQVSVVINGRSYQLACDDGQEAHLMKLAGHINQKVTHLADHVGQIGDTRLLLMASLMVCDELFDSQKKLETTQQNASFQETRGSGQESLALEQVMLALESLSKRLSRLAESIKAA